MKIIRLNFKMRKIVFIHIKPNLRESLSTWMDNTVSNTHGFLYRMDTNDDDGHTPFKCKWDTLKLGQS